MIEGNNLTVTSFLPYICYIWSRMRTQGIITAVCWFRSLQFGRATRTCDMAMPSLLGLVLWEGITLISCASCPCLRFKSASSLNIAAAFRRTRDPSFGYLGTSVLKRLSNWSSSTIRFSAFYVEFVEAGEGNSKRGRMNCEGRNHIWLAQGDFDMPELHPAACGRWVFRLDPWSKEFLVRTPPPPPLPLLWRSVITLSLSASRVFLVSCRRNSPLPASSASLYFWMVFCLKASNLSFFPDSTSSRLVR